MIDFKPIKIQDKELYEKLLFEGKERGCEYSFANLYIWGRQSVAIIGGHFVLFSQFDRKTVYPYPVGQGDKKAVIDALIMDAKQRGIPCRITGLDSNELEFIESLYPEQFHFHCDRDSYDYVYDINDLADLKGKKYHGKRNHYYRFKDRFPDYISEPITENNTDEVQKMADEWYKIKLAENPNGDYLMEQHAISKALANYSKLGFEGIMLKSGGKVLAFTMASKLTNNTLDVHFEKAMPDAEGAYTAINCEFANYIRSKCPEIEYLNREEDMGIEGLRKAKLSYKPHHLTEKCWACLLEDGYDY